MHKYTCICIYPEAHILYLSLCTLYTRHDNTTEATFLYRLSGCGRAVQGAGHFRLCDAAVYMYQQCKFESRHGRTKHLSAQTYNSIRTLLGLMFINIYYKGHMINAIQFLFRLTTVGDNLHHQRVASTSNTSILFMLKIQIK